MRPAQDRGGVFTRQDSLPSHGEPRGQLERQNSLPGDRKRVCYTWKNTGMCRLGSLCRYAHDEELAYVPPDYRHRRWSNAQASTSGAAERVPAVSKPLDFTVMSYNVLADELALQHAKELYLAVPESCLPWRKRVIKLLNELFHWNPDIICLQEIDHPEDFYGPLASQGYAFEYAARTGGRKDGCLTLWRQDKFEAMYRDRISMNRHNLKDNVGLIVILKALGSEPGTPAATLAVANTHLLFNPKRGDIKLGQAGLILRRIADICQDLRIEPLAIFSGDFNSTPQSGVCSFIRTGELDCFLEDRRTLSGQLESGERWPLRPKGRTEPERPRGASLDDPSRSYRTCLGLQPVAPAQQLLPPQNLQLQAGAGQLDGGLAGVGIVLNQRHIMGSLSHCQTFPTCTESFAGLRDARQGGPIHSPGQNPLYPYKDQFGQIVWSHIPPSDADVRRQPFYHDPMVVEEAKPPPPPPGSPPGIPRTVSFAKRQLNAGTWSNEQLLIATGHAPPPDMARSNGSAAKLRPSASSANELWVAEHPIPMQSTYEAVLGTEPAYTSCHSKFIGTVDYVWFTPQAGQLRLTPTAVLLPPPLESLHCGLPSPEWPSDHISLLARFTISVAGPEAVATADSWQLEVPPPLPALLDPSVRLTGPEAALPPPGGLVNGRALPPTDLKSLQQAVEAGILPRIVAAELKERFTA